MNAPKPQAPAKSSLIEEMKEAVASPKPAKKHGNYFPKNRPLKGHPELMALKAELEKKK